MFLKQFLYVTRLFYPIFNRSAGEQASEVKFLKVSSLLHGPYIFIATWHTGMYM